MVVTKLKFRIMWRYILYFGTHSAEVYMSLIIKMIKAMYYDNMVTGLYLVQLNK